MMRNEDRLLQRIPTMLCNRGEPRLNLAQRKVVVRFVEDNDARRLLDRTTRQYKAISALWPSES